VGKKTNLSNQKIDMSSKKFGKLTVVKEHGRNEKGVLLWLCECDCGNEKIASGGSLRSGNTKSCGCLRKEAASKRHRTDLIGRVFEKLTVVSYAHTKNKKIRWNCVCSCGNSVVVAGSNLQNGHTKSCGCFKKEAGKKRRIDLTGKTFERLTVISYSHTDERGVAFWNCTCSCDNKNAVIRGAYLVSGHTRSCGCLNTERINSCFREKNPMWNPDRETVMLRLKIHVAAKALVSSVLKSLGKKKTATSEKLSGYTKEGLKEHMEKLFKPGMSWDNWGEWHIDHIKPVAQFIKEGVTDLKIISSLDNLQPLWAKDNLSKSCKWEG
jgi:hypothetical protein